MALFKNKKKDKEQKKKEREERLIPTRNSSGLAETYENIPAFARPKAIVNTVLDFTLPGVRMQSRSKPISQIDTTLPQREQVAQFTGVKPGLAGTGLDILQATPRAITALGMGAREKNRRELGLPPLATGPLTPTTPIEKAFLGERPVFSGREQTRRTSEDIAKATGLGAKTAGLIGTPLAIAGLALDVVPGVGSASKKAGTSAVASLITRYGDDAIDLLRRARAGDSTLGRTLKNELNDFYRRLPEDARDELGRVVQPLKYKKTGQALDRQLIESAKTSPAFRGIDFATRQYNQVSNAESLRLGKQFIEETFVNLDEARHAIQNKSGLLNNKEVAAAKIIADELVKANRQDDLIDFIDAVAKNATESGRATQAFALFSRLTPSGALKYTEGIINRAKKDVGKDIVISRQVKEAIYNKANEIQNLREGSRLRDVATAELMELIGSQIPKGLLKKIATVHSMSLLLNAKTFLRNIIGNVVINTMETGADVVGAGVDRGVSLFTGQRSKGLPSLGAFGRGAAKGLREGMEDVSKGIRTSILSTDKNQLQGNVFKAFNPKTGKVEPKGVLGRLEKMLGYTLDVPDRAVFEGVVASQADELARLSGKAIDDPDVMIASLEEGLRRTFRDKNVISSALKGVKRELNIKQDFGAGDVVIKFTQVPGSLLKRGIEWSPIGFFDTAWDMLKPSLSPKFLSSGGFNIPAYMRVEDPAFASLLKQRRAVEGVTRAGLGSGVIGTGAILGTLGILKAGQDEDYETARFKEDAGVGKYTVNTSALLRLLTGGNPKPKAGDKTVQYDWLQPASLPLIIGAEIAEAKGDENKSFFLQVANAIAKGAQAIYEQPLFTGIESLATNIAYNKTNIVKAVAETFSALPSTFVPTLLNQLRQFVDPVRRDTFTDNVFEQAGLQILNRLPFASKALVPQVGQYGEERRAKGGLPKRAFNAFVNPANTYKIEDAPEYQEVLRISEATGRKDIIPRIVPDSFTIPNLNGKVELTSREQAYYQTLVGKMTKAYYTKLLSNPKFNELSDSEKADFFKQALEKASTEARPAVLFKKYGITSDKIKTPEQANAYYRAIVDSMPGRNVTEKRKAFEALTLEQQLEMLRAPLR